MVRRVSVPLIGLLALVICDGTFWKTALLPRQTGAAARVKAS